MIYTAYSLGTNYKIKTKIKCIIYNLNKHFKQCSS